MTPLKKYLISITYRLYVRMELYLIVLPSGSFNGSAVYRYKNTTGLVYNAVKMFYACYSRYK